MNKIFTSSTIFYCSIDNKTLKQLLENWATNDFYVKKYLSDNSAQIHYKYAQKVYGDANFILKYDEQKELLSLETSPIPRTYILFFVPPLSFIILYNTKNLSSIYFITPILFFIFLCIMLKWGVEYSNDELKKSIKLLLIKNKIKYTLDNDIAQK